MRRETFIEGRCGFHSVFSKLHHTIRRKDVKKPKQLLLRVVARQAREALALIFTLYDEHEQFCDFSGKSRVDTNYPRSELATSLIRLVACR